MFGLLTFGRGRGGFGVAERVESFAGGTMRGIDLARLLTGGLPNFGFGVFGFRMG